MSSEPVDSVVAELEDCARVLVRIRDVVTGAEHKLNSLCLDGLLWAEVIDGGAKGRFGRVKRISISGIDVYVHLFICSRSKPYRALDKLPIYISSVYSYKRVRFVHAVPVDANHSEVVIAGTSYILKNSNFAG